MHLFHNKWMDVQLGCQCSELEKSFQSEGQEKEFEDDDTGKKSKDRQGKRSGEQLIYEEYVQVPEEMRLLEMIHKSFCIKASIQYKAYECCIYC